MRILMYPFIIGSIYATLQLRHQSKISHLLKSCRPNDCITVINKYNLSIILVNLELGYNISSVLV